jgi:hypothetical protein
MKRTAFAVFVAALALGRLIGQAFAVEGTPTVADLQGAYDREAGQDSALHDKDLKIVGAECQPAESARFFCEVGFVKTGDDPDRVYLDAAVVEREAPTRWKLLSGLCRRPI